MKRITLGRTGININRFGFGGIPIQRVDEDQTVETVRHALMQGVDFIDTSRAYTTSERRIGKAFKAGQPEGGSGVKMLQSKTRCCACRP